MLMLLYGSLDKVRISAGNKVKLVTAMLSLSITYNSKEMVG
jgi:hypothetical protein